MPKLLTTADAAKILQVNRKEIIQLLQCGLLKGKKVGRGWIVDGTSVIAYQQRKNKP